MELRMMSLMALGVMVGISESHASGNLRVTQDGVVVGQNVRLYPSNVTQTETFIVRHPSNPDVLFASANTINLNTGFVSEGVYVTTDGGTSWRGNDTCIGAPITFHRGDPGIAIDKNGTFILSRLGFSPGMFAHFSTDLGVTWSSQRTIATNDQDRGTLASDVEDASTFYGRTYAAWVKFAFPFAVHFSYSDNGGQTWSAPAQVNNPALRGQGGEVTIGPDGSVILTWAGVTNVSPFTEDFVGFARSTDGGLSWTILENAFDVNGISGVLPAKGNIRVNGLPRIATDASFGSRRGWIYVVTTERGLAPAGSDPDIILHRSTDEGGTWSTGIRVNTDPLNNGRTQYFPAIHVDHTGGVNVLYYDDRLTSVDSAGVFLSRSTDGGDTWSDYRISDHYFKPQAIGGLGQGYQGDNIAMTSVGDTLWPVWMDNSTGIYQIWTCPVNITTLTHIDEEPLPSGLILHQNYPNPFNPSTRITYTVPSSGGVLLEVFDVLGRRVALLVDSHQERGDHSVEFPSTITGLASGVYRYRLQFGGTSLSKTMVLLR